MAKSKRDPVREERIHEEVIVDAYGPEEQAINPDESTREAIKDWHYWVAQGYRF